MLRRFSKPAISICVADDERGPRIRETDFVLPANRTWMGDSLWTSTARLRKMANGSPTFAHVASFPPRLARLPNAKRPRERAAFLAQRVAGGYFLTSPNLPRSVFTKRASFPLAAISRNTAE